MSIFKPAWMDYNEAKALRAVASMKNEAQLTSAAQKAPLPAVQLAAVRSIAGQGMLMVVAMTPPSAQAPRVPNGCRPETVEAAVQKLTGTFLLDFILSLRPLEEMQHTALARLQDAEQLEYAAENAYHDSVRIAACERLGGHIFEAAPASPGIYECSRCKTSITVLDEDGKNKLNDYKKAETRDVWWDSRAGYTRYASGIEHYLCVKCGCITPHLVKSAEKYHAPSTMYSHNDKLQEKSTSSECLVCHDSSAYTGR